MRERKIRGAVGTSPVRIEISPGIDGLGNGAIEADILASELYVTLPRETFVRLLNALAEKEGMIVAKVTIERL